MSSRPKPIVLMILDGWGYSQEEEHNAISEAATPVWDRLWSQCPHMLIHCSGSHVGLPDEQMGNSEVGHMNLGAGRTVYQDFTRISLAVEDGSLGQNPALVEAVDAAGTAGGNVHIMGLLSPGGVHSHEDHIRAMVEMALARGAAAVYVHAFLDGRDTPPRSAARSLQDLDTLLRDSGRGRIASLVGRYYAMDRDNRWDRVQEAYDALTLGRAAHSASDALAGLEAAYARGEDDEFVKATVIVPEGAQVAPIQDGDAVIFMNFRADRARELTHAFVDEPFEGFQRSAHPKVHFVCLAEYEAGLPAAVAFPPEDLSNVFGEYVSGLGLKQLRIAETEKYAHVTFFFNGGREEPFPGEDRILVPSPKVATYDLQPEMSANEVTDRLVEAIEGGSYDFIVCNYANPDMVGHTGVMEAAVKAIETVDHCLGRIEEALRRAGGEMLITADHGNAELMRDVDSGQAYTAHTTNVVPLIYVGRSARLAEEGSLADISPTLLALAGLEQPADMSGRSLVTPG